MAERSKAPDHTETCWEKAKGEPCDCGAAEMNRRINGQRAKLRQWAGEEVK